MPLPSLEDFASASLPYRNGDWFNPPALTNFLGCLQAAPDLLAIQHLTFAPYSLGESWLGTLVFNDRKLHTTGETIEFIWRPDRIVRRMHHDGYELETVTVMGVRRQTVHLTLRVTNAAAQNRTARLRVLAGEGVIRSDRSWRTPYSPREHPTISTTPWEGTPPPETLVRNRRNESPDGDGLIFHSQTSQACVLQVTRPAPDRIDGRNLCFAWDLAAGETRELSLLIAIGADEAEVAAERAAWLSAPVSPESAAEADWRSELAAVFTPGNDRYSGHLPTLLTDNADLRAVYLNAVITVVYFKREHPLAPGGRTYTTLMPRYWVTTSFLNDWSLAGLLLAMLDPACLRRMVEHWLAGDIHAHFGSEYVTGGPAGNWYSCNDYAIVRLISWHVRVSGDTAWLDQPVAGRTIREHVIACATHHRSLDRGSGLADYGDRNSLLEAVGAYEHEVASLNAANVWMLREAAALLDRAGDSARAADFRLEADTLVPRIQRLYAPGEGTWHCRRPDGTLVKVRHAWDFIHTLNFLHADLPAAQIAEMVAFFRRELMSPTWMAALSPLDDDTGFSLRPDHQWNGSYPAWVSLAASALLKAGRDDLLADWLPGLAASGRQGPYAQAHFVETFAPPLAGGARQAPPERPNLNHRTCLSAGNFFETVVLDLFGLAPGYNRLAAHPRLARFDRQARLLNVPWHGRNHTVDADGRIDAQAPSA
jgi:hypothetical protein